MGDAEAFIVLITFEINEGVEREVVGEVRLMGAVGDESGEFGVVFQLGAGRWLHKEAAEVGVVGVFVTEDDGVMVALDGGARGVVG